MKTKFQNLPSLVDSVTLKVANITKYGDSQVEIRDAKTKQLIWRAWDFEPGFEADFSAQIEFYRKR